MAARRLSEQSIHDQNLSDTHGTMRLHSSSVRGQVRRCPLNEIPSTVPMRHWDVESHGWSSKKHRTLSSWIVPVTVSQPARVIKGTF